MEPFIDLLGYLFPPKKKALDAAKLHAGALAFRPAGGTLLPRHLDLPGLSPRPLGPVPALGGAISVGMCAGTHRGMDMHLDACVPTSGKLPEESGSAKSNTPLAKGYNLFLAENNNNQDKIPTYCCSSLSFSYRICITAAQSYFSEIPRCSQTPALMSGNSRRLKLRGSFTPLGLWLCGLAITRQLCVVRGIFFPSSGL